MQVQIYDLHDITTGKAVYGADVNLPGVKSEFQLPDHRHAHITEHPFESHATGVDEPGVPPFIPAILRYLKPPMLFFGLICSTQSLKRFVMDIVRSGGISQRSRSAYKPVSSWFFPHPVAWIVLALLVVAEAIWIPLAGFSFRFGDTWMDLTFAAALTAIGMALSRYDQRRLTILAFTVAFSIFFGKQGNVLNYLAHSLGFPWADAGLAQIERAMGFDWVAHLAWLNDHQIVANFLLGGYSLLQTLAVLTIVALIFIGEFEKLREFLIISAVALLITTAIGAVFPAGGTYHFYQPATALQSNIDTHSGQFFLVHLIPVHDGTMKSITLDHVAGLITFPSFHMVMAVLMAWATRRTVVFPVFAAFSFVMALATPVFGGHYLPDLVGGVFVAAFSVWIYYLWFGREVSVQMKSAKRILTTMK